ncbi:MAG: thymidine kinase [Candidatus Caccosoma sp.]|nr:thymidine kinase [Candidatus Caccosoma sp.]
MYRTYKPGWIEVICGCMFAGKTEEIIKRIKVFEYAKKNVVAIKPTIDNRYSDSMIASHAGNFCKCECVDIHDLKKIEAYIDNESIDAIFIEEVQFFDIGIVDICERLANSKKRVIVCGLDTNFKGEPFEVTSALLARAEFVTKLTAVCTQCGAPATRTQRLINGKPAKYSDPVVLVGASECYEARCRFCHKVIK